MGYDKHGQQDLESEGPRRVDVGFSVLVVDPASEDQEAEHEALEGQQELVGVLGIVPTRE